MRAFASNDLRFLRQFAALRSSALAEQGHRHESADAWLREYVDTGLRRQRTGAQADHGRSRGRETWRQIGDGWDNVYVGHVERSSGTPTPTGWCWPTVDGRRAPADGGDRRTEHRAGQKVALALVGARLIDGHSEGQAFKTLKPGTIRGVRSEGMVCSEKELGLSDEHEGIMVLEATRRSARRWRLARRHVIEFEITPEPRARLLDPGHRARSWRPSTAARVTLPARYDMSQAPQGAPDLVTIEADRSVSPLRRRPSSKA